MSVLRSFDRRDFSPGQLVAAQGDRIVSVCLPARNEEPTVGTIVEHIVPMPFVDEVVVVDDGSLDATARVAADAGATVVTGPGRGKGAALAAGVEAAKGDVLVFCDADLREFDPAFITGLAGPLLLHDDIEFVKGRYERPEGGGRVTELVAKPLIAVLFPLLAGFDQPLAGEVAARRDLLERLPPFVEGYGVDISLLIDVVAAVGLHRVAQVDLGVRLHRNRPLNDLRHEAEAVLRAALERAGWQ